MRVAPHSDQVREIVRHSLAELVSKPIEPEALSEAILIRDGRYRGRSYRAAGLMAMWFAELGFVQVYDGQGNMLRTINLFEEQSMIRRAA